MRVWYKDKQAELRLVDKGVAGFEGIPDNSIDSIVTDPPYHLYSIVKRFGGKDAAPAKDGRGAAGPYASISRGFMGKEWDNTGIAYNVDLWKQVLRVLKPGGHLLSFGGSRTYHRLACAIEDAGFEIRDQIMWIYGSGFPKSLNIGKQSGCDAWKGWGTALKPAHEPIVVARKPISEKNIAENVLRWGTGGVNVDGCRVEHFETPKVVTRTAIDKFWQGKRGITKPELHMGRFPANLIHDGSDEVLECFPETKSGRLGIGHQSGNDFGVGNKTKKPNLIEKEYGNDYGSAARFFYCAKASKAERDAGCEDLPIKRPDNRTDTGMGSFAEKGVQEGKNHHPTVKPKALMQYLCRIVTPLNGVILDPFLGSGTTAVAAIAEGFRYLGVEKEPEYCEIAAKRIEAELAQADFLRDGEL